MKIIHGDCLEVLKRGTSDSIDLLCTDPPYGYSFMGKDWDKAVPSVEVWKECLRVLKPGAFAFVMSAPRSDVQSRMALRLEEAGFEIAFTPIYWTYASGFPKAMSISKAIDRRAGAEREVIGVKVAPNGQEYPRGYEVRDTPVPFERSDGLETAPATTEAKALDGSYGGFQPKPSVEIIIRAQKPLTTQAELTIMTSQVMSQINALCLDAFPAEKISTLPQTLREDIARGVALDWHIEAAITEAGKVGGTSVPMDTLKSTLERLAASPSTSWSIGSLWNAILVELLARVSTFTTETVSRTITDLRTLSFLLSQSTQGTITPDEMFVSGRRLNVGAVESVLRSVLTSFSPNGITALSDASSVLLPEGAVQGSANDATRSFNGEAKASSDGSALNSATSRPEVRVILVAMKPLSEKTYVDQAMKNGKGVTWLDDSRIPTAENLNGGAYSGGERADGEWKDGSGFKNDNLEAFQQPQGRFPANLIVSDDVLNDGRVSKSAGGKMNRSNSRNDYGKYDKETVAQMPQDSGSYSRFFSLDSWAQNLPEHVRKVFPFLIVPKAAKSEKNRGLDGFEEKPMYKKGGVGGTGGKRGVQEAVEASLVKNNHPTTKPLTLMSYLITLGSRPGDVVLDPFAGSFTTCCAAKALGRKFVGIEREAEYVEIGRARVAAVPDPMIN